MENNINLEGVECLEGEIWKYIPNTDNKCIASNCGRFYSHIKKDFLLPTINKKTNQQSLRTCGNIFTPSRLVYELFDRKLEINELIIYNDSNIFNININNLSARNKKNPLDIKEPPKLDENEIWKKNDKYDDHYLISNYGRVYSNYLNRLLNPKINNSGYNTIIMTLSGEKKSILLHRLVIETFVGEIPPDKVVDHINRIRTDNNFKNLRIVSQKDNSNNKTPRKNTIIKYDLNNNIIKEYNSTREIMKDLNMAYGNNGSIYRAIKNNKPIYNFIWKYKNPVEKQIAKDDFIKIGLIDNINFDNYSINKFGQIRNDQKNTILKQSINSGYMITSLTSNKINYSYATHRLVAIKFIQCDDKSKTNVNHIDENKLNNHVDNLEWMTPKENTTYSCGKKVKQIDINTNECIKIFNSLNEAAMEVSGKRYKEQIQKVCNGVGKTSYGYKWEWHNE